MLHPIFNAPHVAELRTTKLHSRCSNKVKDRLQVFWILTYDPEDTRGGRLMRQCFFGLCKLPRVVDGDDCMFGEVFNQRNVRRGERAHLAAAERYCADGLTVAHQGYG